MSVDEVAGLLGVPRGFVYSLSRRGELPTVRLGERYVRYRFRTIETWIAEQESTAPKGTRRPIGSINPARVHHPAGGERSRRGGS
ncbi:MAG: helix-turn-helix domain-containing protein [Solirubrobacteraceae bacterium]